MENRTKRIAVIQDLSCIGRCSLGVAMSILPAMGAETAVLPTAILSCHTAFESFTFLDFTPEAEQIMAKWQELKLRFDAIYIGYLGSLKLIHLAEKFISIFREEGAQVILDPAFGDHGKLYTGFDEAYVQGMKELCREADIILPNMTEASFMLDVPYTETYDRAYIEEMLKKLAGLGAKCAVLTGVSFETGKVGFMGYDSRSGEFFEYYNERVPAAYHGTGDIFASVVTGGLARGLSLYKALQIAADYTAQCIRVTLEDPRSVAYGVNFEEVIPSLVQWTQDAVKEAAK